MLFWGSLELLTFLKQPKWIGTSRRNSRGPVRYFQKEESPVSTFTPTFVGTFVGNLLTIMATSCGYEPCVTRVELPAGTIRINKFSFQVFQRTKITDGRPKGHPYQELVE